MFWKIVLGLGFFGVVLALALIIISVRAFYALPAGSPDEDVVFGGLLMSIILLIVSLLATLVAGIFVLRSSKKEWDAKNLK
ncbi:MAG: hypothetical protein JSS81_12495 [Acidobacteria bacterium]|nr:hypothetical protein [Acidobacteriota bacterium]